MQAQKSGLIRTTSLLILLLCSLNLAGKEKNTQKVPASIPLTENWQYCYGENEKNIPPAKDVTWSSIKTPMNPPGREDRTLLRLRYPLPRNHSWNDAAIFFPPFIIKRYEAFLGEKKIFSSRGDTFTSAGKIDIRAFPWQIVPLGTEWQGKYLELRIFSDFQNIGLYEKIYIGSKAGHLRRIVEADILRIILAALFFLLSIISLMTFIMRRDQNILAGFSLFTISIAIYIAVHTDMIFLLFENPRPLAWLWLFSVYFLPVGFLLFLKSISKKPFAALRVLAIVFSCLGATALLLSFISPDHTLSLRIPLYLGYLVFMPYIAFVLVREAATGNRDARILAGGIIALLVTFVPALFQALFGFMSEVEAPIYAGAALLAAAMIVVMIKRLTSTYRELEVYSKRLREADRQKDEFLAQTSHELRTPLNGIMGIAETLLAEMGENINKTSHRYLSLIIASSRRLSNLVNDILDYSKLKNSEIRLSRAPLDMKALTDVVIEFMNPMVQNRDITIINRIPENLSPAYADEERCHQILYNLIGNAIKFTNAGEVTISAKEEKSDDGSERNLIEFSITDTGTGIDKQFQEKIFAPWQQGDENNISEYGGTGIGLFIVRQLVELHGGTITVSSTPGRGSSFIFSLPRSHETEKKARPRTNSFVREMNTPSETESDVVPRLPDSGAHILVVDDDPINLEVLRSIFRKSGFSVTTATNGNDALDVIIEREQEHDPPFDLILLDVMMPRMSGYELTSLVRHRYSMHDLPIIVVTARNTIPDLVAAFNAGANDYITKPINRKELLARAGNLVTLHRMVREHRESRYKLLQERMSPHFLFNALNTIHALLMKDPEAADEAVLKLAHNYRYILNYSFKKKVSFNEEWDFVINYLSLEELFFRDHLTVTTEKVGDFHDIEIPPLIIQPVVENALKHGVYNVDDHGVIYLRAERTEKEIIITVQDNGNGLGDSPGKKRSLSNILERLQYFYENAALEILENPHRGVTVAITFSPEEKKVTGETENRKEEIFQA